MEDKFLLIMIMTLMFTLGLAVMEYINTSDFSAKVISNQINSSCYNLSLVDTSNCLRDELKTFWFYNISNVGKELTIDEVKKIGGVCSHASQFYLDNLKDKGFYTKDIIIDTNETTAHEFIIVSNNESYCTLDQTVVKCSIFGGSDEN